MNDPFLDWMVRGAVPACLIILIVCVLIIILDDKKAKFKGAFQCGKLLMWSGFMAVAWSALDYDLGAEGRKVFNFEQGFLLLVGVLGGWLQFIAGVILYCLSRAEPKVAVENPFDKK